MFVFRVNFIRTQSSGEKDLMTEGNTLPRAWGLPCFLWRIQWVNQLYLETVSRKETADASQSTCDLAMLLICLDDDDQIPSSSCFGWLHSLITSYPLSQRCFLLPSPKVESMANSSETATMVPTIRIVGEYNSVSSVQSIGWTVSRIHREARPWISTIIDCQILWQSGWRQPSPRYWRETQEEYGGRAASQINKQMVSWTSHA